jgi:hypothetical protein
MPFSMFSGTPLPPFSLTRRPHPSTLDPVLRGEAGGPSWQAFAILAVAGLYLFSSPGAQHAPAPPA